MGLAQSVLRISWVYLYITTFPHPLMRVETELYCTWILTLLFKRCNMEKMSKTRLLATSFKRILTKMAKTADIQWQMGVD